MSTEVVAVALASLVVTAAAVPLCIALARRLDIVDRPGPLKDQREPVPYLGGVAVFAGTVTGACAGRPIVLIPMAAALAVGVGDDQFDLPAPARLAAQLGVGVVIALVQPVHLPVWIGFPLLVAVTVIVINGFNLLDGLDALASGVAAAGAVGFAAILTGSALLLAVSLAAALVAFLWYNRPPARVYLGDGGSYLIGATMTVLLASAWGPSVSTVTGVVAAGLLVVPVAEVACAVVRRWRGGRSLLAGDRAHPYDLLVARGWSRTRASAVYIGIEVVVVASVTVLGHSSMVNAVTLDVAAAAVVLTAAALVGGMGNPTGSRS